MKVLFIIESLRSGGKERRLVSLIEGLIQNHEVNIELLLLSKDIHYTKVFDFGIPIHYLGRHAREDLFIFSKFYKILRNFRPDVVHCWDNIAAFHFAPIAKLLNVKFVNSMITSAPPLRKFSKKRIISSFTYPFSDVVLSNSKAGLKAYGAPQDKSQVIYNGFDFNRIENLRDKKKIREEYSIPPGKKVIGMVASFTLNKDYLNFLNYCLVLKKKYHFVAIGDGPQLKAISARASTMGLENISFLGRLKDVESVINIFDIAVLISNPKYHGEGISNAIMEYMALSKLVIASDNGGNKEIVEDGKTGFLLKSNEPSEFRKVVKMIEKNEGLINKMGTEGKKRLKSHFSLDDMVNSTFNLYRRLN